MATEVITYNPLPDPNEPTIENVTPRPIRNRVTSFDSPTSSSLNRIRARLIRTEPDPDPRSSRTFNTSTAPKRTTGVRRKAVSSAPAKKTVKAKPTPQPVPVKEVNVSNPKPADPDKAIVLEEENAKLKLKVAALEAYQALEYDDPDKLGKVRLRVLKAQNLQLERQLVIASLSTSSARKIKSAVSQALKDLKAKILELQKAERITEPAPTKPEPASTKSPVAKRSTSAPRASRLFSSPKSASSSLSKSANTQPWKSGSSNTKPTPTTPTRRSPFGGSESTVTSTPTARRASLTWNKNLNSVTKTPRNARVIVTVPEPTLPPIPPPPPQPKVAVELDWVEEMEKWTNLMLERLSKPLTDIGKTNEKEEKSVSEEKKEGEGEGEGEGESASEIKPLEEKEENVVGGKESEKEDELFHPVAVSEFLPFIPGAGNRFLIQSNEKSSSSSASISMSLLSEESIPLMKFSHVHELEDRLTKLHPKMIRLAGLLRSMVLPSLPASTTSSLQKEVRSIDSEIFETSKALGELVLLLPGKGSLLGSNAAKSAETSANLQRKEAEIASIVQKEAEEEEKRSSRRDEDDQWTSLYGNAFRKSEKAKEKEAEEEKERREKESFVSRIPEFDEFFSSLPPFQGGEEAQGFAKRLFQSLIEKFKKLEAVWHSEKIGLNEEMEFYKGCHTVQATHMKQIMSAGREALESVMNYGLEIASNSANSLNQILDALRDYHETQSQESLNRLLNQLENGLPSLQQYVDLVPLQFNDSIAKSKANSVMDPLEEEYKDRLKALFGGLQARRASLFNKGGSHAGSPAHSKAPSFAKKSFSDFPKPVW